MVIDMEVEMEMEMDGFLPVKNQLTICDVQREIPEKIKQWF